ncbi:hypothetical protein Q0812_13215 [Brevundimonas sp. 2R-24]|uniref:Uncharacterized protein n=1 Tax=Peiella sedimenti TaxID=3061083 RepID=A0ABT8SQT6_9CAUL|nr:hypothetical protein [Caulobacteraceae bacterium XZ-24]
MLSQIQRNRGHAFAPQAFEIAPYGDGIRTLPERKWKLVGMTLEQASASYRHLLAQQQKDAA